MAILTSSELASLRKALRKGNPGMTKDFTKPEINATFQAAEDWFESGRTEFGTAMQSGTAHIFTNPELKIIGGVYLELKGTKEIG